MKRYVTFIDRRYDLSPPGPSGYPSYSLKLEAFDYPNQNFTICIDNDEDEKNLLDLLKWIPKEENKKMRKLSREEQEYLRSFPSSGVHYK